MRVLLADDDELMRDLIAAVLEAQGHAVEAFADGDAVWAAFSAAPAPLVVLDWQMPGADGLEVCRRIRAHSAVPIIMVTARGETTDRVVGLELGADDYLPKPYDPRELLARIRAVLRRRGETAAGDVLRFGRLEIDRGARRVRVDGQDRALTSRQFDLLAAMAERAGRVLTRDQLVDLVGADGPESIDRAIDVHVVRIRAAIEDDPRHPRRVLTVRGAGYVFARVQE